ncbi:MAG: beta-ketoacyl-[acyl-carrier-protein] synthase family protein [Planctomycetota bacterium]|nr:beta-ketoacyl-[acyl-carrier-protein] synthase family protein [Planctomycetota bacterium]
MKRNRRKSWKSSASVVVTGYGAVTALGRDAHSTWRRLCAGESGVAQITLFDASPFYSHEAAEIKDLQGISTRWPIGRAVSSNNSGLQLFDGRASLDRGSIFLRAACREAVHSADLAETIRVRPERVGLVAGTTLGGMTYGTRFYREYRARGAGRAHASLLRDYLLHGQTECAARSLGIGGPVVTVTNACAAGTSALGIASAFIRAGKADVVLAGGFDSFCEFIFAGFSSLQAIAREKCRPFDRRRNGMVLGEGAGIIALESGLNARSRERVPRTELLSVADSCDAYHITRPDPGGEGAARAMARALKEAELEPAEIGYVNAHGTGTQSNDEAEAVALAKVFGAELQNVLVSSTKAAVGHLLGGAGGVEAVFTVMALEDGSLPPTTNHDVIAPECAGLQVIRSRAIERRVDAAMSSSFGFGGQNSVAVFGAV